MFAFLANPDRFMAFSRRAAPIFGALAVALIAVGLWFTFAAPARPERPKTTPERLARSEKRMAEHQAAMRKRNDAIRAFYGQLSPSQQKAFDALHMGMPGMRHGPGGPGERRVRVIRRGGPAGGPGRPSAMMSEEGPGALAFLDGEDEEFEIELGEGPDTPDQ